MAEMHWSNIPEKGSIHLGGSDLKIVLTMQSRLDSYGHPEGGPDWLAFNICVPVAESGEAPLMSICKAATSPMWVTQTDDESKWVKAILTLDNHQKKSISYECGRILIDGYRLHGSDTGTGLAETMQIRALVTERRIDGQDPTPYRKK